jgi:LPXTG-motif cell wall-anchored protein
MRNSRMLKGITTMVAVVCMMMLMTTTVFAATKDVLKDGVFSGTGFINAGELVDGTVQGPGNWTQLNLGDATVDAAYLHIIVKATGDTAAAQIVISDAYTFNLVADLGITLTEEYQDVVLPIQEAGATSLSWGNFMGLDGGSSVYTIKDIFLSDDAAATITAAVPEVTATEDTAAAEATEVPKTGSSDTLAIVALAGMVGSAFVLVRQKKAERV